MNNDTTFIDDIFPKFEETEGNKTKILENKKYL